MGFPRLEVPFAAMAPASEKDGVKLRCVEVHPAKPWVACVDEHENVSVWDFERKELVGSFSPQALREQQVQYDKTNASLRAHVQTGQPPPPGAEADESGAYYDKTLRTGLTQSKVGNVKAIGFFDADYVCAKLGMAVPLGGGGLTGEWVLLVTEHRLILVDVLTLECRHLTTHELGKHAGVSSVEAAGYSTLALGCSDGHLRLWDVRQWALLPVGPSPGGMSLQGHAKDVIRVSAVTQAEASGTSIRLLTLGLEGSLLLWRSNDIDPRTLLDDPCVPVGVEGLRLVGRLEGGVSVKAESSVSPSLLYNRYNDSVALMDAARTVSVWDLWRMAREPSPAHRPPLLHRRRSSTFAGPGTPKAHGAVGDVVVIPRVARYKAPSTLGKLRDITTAILPQYPSRCFVASNKSGSLFVLDDAGKTDDGVTPATDGRESPRTDDGAASVKAVLSILEELDLRRLISTDKAVQSKLKIYHVAQHPSRSHTLVVGHNYGLSVVLLDRHMQHSAATVPAWGPSSVLVFEHHSLMHAWVRVEGALDHMATAAPRPLQAYHRIGTLVPDVVLAGDLAPVTSGPGVRNAQAAHGGTIPGGPDAALARQNAARHAPELLVSRSSVAVCVYWRAVAYYMLLPLPSTEPPRATVTRSQSNVSTSSAGTGVPRPASLSIPRTPVLSPSGSSPLQLDMGPALDFAWLGGPAYGSSTEGASELRDLFVAILPGAEARVGGEGGKKKSGLFRKSKATGGDETAIYVPSSIVIKELVHTRRGEGELLSYSTTLHVLSLLDEASVPLNPCAAFGGHADVALLGWLPETLPPSDEAETLRQASAQFMQLHRPAAQDEGKKAVVKVKKLGPVLPPVVAVAWDMDGRQCCVATLEDGVHIYHLLPSPSTSGDKANSGEGPSADIFWTASLRLSTPFEVPMSMTWQHGSLFVATQSSLHLYLPPPLAKLSGGSADMGVDEFLLATHTARVPPCLSMLKGVLSQPLADTTEEVALGHRDPDSAASELKPFRYMWDSVIPHPQHMPRGQVQVLGVFEGGLLVRGAHGLCVQVVALEHPSVRMAMLLAANHPQRAMNWAKALEPHLHDDVALHIVEPRATSPAVVQHAIRALTGLSLGVALELCIRYSLTDLLCYYLTTARDVVDMLQQVDFVHTPDPLGLPYVQPRQQDAGEESGAWSVLPLPSVPTIHRVGVVLASAGRTDMIRDLLLPACRRKGRLEDAAYLVHLVGNDELRMEVLLEAKQAHVAALLLRNKPQGTAPSLKTVVDTWQQSLLSAPHRPPEVYGQVQVMLEGDESGPH